MADGSTEAAAVEQEQVADMVAVAAELLDLFPPPLRSRAQLSPIDEEVTAERLRWYYTPTDHGGVALREMTARQQSLTMRLLATGLTRPAYVTACAVLGLENVLDELEGWHVDWGRERGRDPGLYWVRIFGRPGDAEWGWRFGGHHVSVNLLVRHGRVASSTPSFLGADPARSPLLGGDLRPLGPTEDLARDLLRSLDPDQRRQATLHPRAISDIVSGNRPVVRAGDQMMHMPDLFRGRLETPRLAALVEMIDDVAESGTGYGDDDHARLALSEQPAGLAARDLSEDQRDLLRRLMAAYTDRSPSALASGHRACYRDDRVLDPVCFGWAGDDQPGRPHYYRVSGSRLLIEYDNTQRDANHAHSVWRDPRSDFGLDPVTERVDPADVQ